MVPPFRLPAHLYPPSSTAGDHDLLRNPIPGTPGATCLPKRRLPRRVRRQPQRDRDLGQRLRAWRGERPAPCRPQPPAMRDDRQGHGDHRERGPGPDSRSSSSSSGSSARRGPICPAGNGPAAPVRPRPAPPRKAEADESALYKTGIFIARLFLTKGVGNSPFRQSPTVPERRASPHRERGRFCGAQRFKRGSDGDIASAFSRPTRGTGISVHFKKESQ